MNEKIYFISDIEMGRGDISDDFSDDAIFADFLEKIKSKTNDEKNILVLLEDIFDFLKMSYKGTFPRYITEEISLWKMDEIIQNHKLVFGTLKKFLENPNHEVHFIIGNHDPDLAWPKVQKRIQEALRTHNRVKFDYKFRNKDIHAEHGHLQDPFFENNTKKLFLKYRGEKILNLPWGAYACFSHLNHVKRKFPKEECLFPNPLALESNTEFKKFSKNSTWNLAIKSLIINPIIHFYDPTYRAPFLKLINHVLRFGFELVDDEKFINHRVNKVIRNNPDKNLIVLGHAHVLTNMEKHGRKIFITDTWRNEYDLNKNAKKKPKSYVKIEYEGSKLKTAELKKILN
jgi:hypothetical protein